MGIVTGITTIHHGRMAVVITRTDGLLSPLRAATVGSIPLPPCRVPREEKMEPTALGSSRACNRRNHGHAMVLRMGMD